MKDFIDSREYRLTCISPVHIGSGETFKAFEYLYDRKNKKVGFIQEEKWQKTANPFWMILLIKNLQK